MIKYHFIVAKKPGKIPTVFICTSLSEGKRVFKRLATKNIYESLEFYDRQIPEITWDKEINYETWHNCTELYREY